MLHKNVYEPYGIQTLADLTKNQPLFQNLLLQSKIKDNLQPNLILHKLCFDCFIWKKHSFEVPGMFSRFNETISIIHILINW